MGSRHRRERCMISRALAAKLTLHSPRQVLSSSEGVSNQTTVPASRCTQEYAIRKGKARIILLGVADSVDFDLFRCSCFALVLAAESSQIAACWRLGVAAGQAKLYALRRGLALNSQPSQSLRLAELKDGHGYSRETAEA